MREIVAYQFSLASEHPQSVSAYSRQMQGLEQLNPVKVTFVQRFQTHRIDLFSDTVPKLSLKPAPVPAPRMTIASVKPADRCEGSEGHLQTECRQAR